MNTKNVISMFVPDSETMTEMYENGLLPNGVYPPLPIEVRRQIDKQREEKPKQSLYLFEIDGQYF